MTRPAPRHLSEILRVELLAKLSPDLCALHVFETGTIRTDSDAGQTGDGWSTLTFAEAAAKQGSDSLVVSVDLEVRVAQAVLEKRGVADRVELRCGHSISEMAREISNTQNTFDVVFLDSDNDEKLIFHEFLIARFLVSRHGFVVIDDVRMPHHTEGEPAKAKKGDLVLPYLNANRIPYELHERQGWGSYRTGVLVIPAAPL